MKPTKKIGKQTIKITNDVKIIGSASVVGQKESEGPYGNQFDIVMDDGYYGEKTWEKAEAKMQTNAVVRAISNAQKSIADMDIIFCGDLLNQCTSTSYGLRSLDIPVYGLYGACSTMAESMSIGAIFIDDGASKNVVCGASSHFCSSERQFRMPLAYGGQRPPTAQNTVTGCGMTVLSDEGDGPYITAVTTGKMVDKGVTDALNMGAAMAPAAVDTLLTHFEDTNTTPNNYDLIVSGDLGVFGHDIVCDLMQKNGYKMNNYTDCGMLIYDIKKQDMHCGGSGCGCSGVILASYLLKEMKKKKLNKILFMGTGALMSPTLVEQGESIPSIAHAVVISNTKE